MTAQIPQTIGPYSIKRLLAEGGMGRLFIARRDSIGGVGIPCVLKVIHPERKNDDHMLTDLFYREAKISSLMRHQNIVQILDFGEAEGELFIAMEYVEGADLRALMRKGQFADSPISVPLALRIAVEVLKGLIHAHGRTDDAGKPLGIVHRDLTPNNILISREGEVKIADFGIAKSQVTDTLSEPGDIKGKFHYLSPEQVESRPASPGTDLWALGVVLYEVITGRKPFTGESVTELLAKIVRGEYKPPSLASGAPACVDRIVERALRTDPARRYGSAREMLEDVEAALAEFPPTGANAVRDYYFKVMPQETPAPRVEKRHVGSTVVGAKNHALEMHYPPAHIADEPKSTLTKSLKFAAAIAFLFLAGIIFFMVKSFATNHGSNLGVVSPAVETPATPGPNSASPSVAPMESQSPSPPPALATPTPVKSTPVPTPETKTLATPAQNVGANPAINEMPPPAPAAKPLDQSPPSSIGTGVLWIGKLDPYAEIIVDGISKKVSPRQIELEEGPHTVILRNAEFGKEKTLQVTILPGKTVAINDW